jgi:hypothetical protein
MFLEIYGGTLKLRVRPLLISVLLDDAYNYLMGEDPSSMS